MLDEKLRRRVAEIASADVSLLDTEMEARILARVALDGPKIVRRARTARTALLAAGPLLAAAAAVALLAGWHHSKPSAVPAPALASVVGAPVCASRLVSDGARAGFMASGDASRLDLGPVAVATGTSGSKVRLAEAGPCRTVIALESGTVAVHAKDLGGGELRVRAPGGEVVVHGTIFAVSQVGDAMAVEVAEGRVTVVDRVGTQTVSTGERLLVSAVGLARGALSTDRAREVRLSVGAPQVVGLDALQPFAEGATASRAVEPSQKTGAPAEVSRGSESATENVELREDPASAPAAPTPKADPLAMAEEARRAGDFARARELYRRAADGTGVTAEAAWVALARMELSLGHVGAARDATKQRQQRFGQGTLGPEALWIDVRTYRQTGDLGRARELANELVERWPSSPQARAAREWLSAE